MPAKTPTRAARAAAAALTLALLLCAPGCSTFDRDFTAARTAAAAAAPPGSVEGPWQGDWQSENGHGGGWLKAIFTRTAPDTIHARFRSGFWKLFAAEDEVDLKIANAAAPLHVTGQADLGFLKGGVYTYDAIVTPDRFDATYRMKFDHGTFHMSRP